MIEPLRPLNSDNFYDDQAKIDEMINQGYKDGIQHIKKYNTDFENWCDRDGFKCNKNLFDKKGWDPSMAKYGH